MTLWTELSDLDFSIRRIQVGEWSTRVLETGTGFPFILMHGTGGHLEAFTKNLRALSADHRVVAYDYPGHGWTTTTTTDLEIDDYIEHLVQLLDVLEIDRAHISGESLGGWVALKFAARHPERVASLVLNTPGGTMATPEVMERIRSLSQAAADDPSEERIRARLEWLMADPASVTDELVDVRRGVYARPGFADSMRHILCLQDPEVRQAQPRHRRGTRCDHGSDARHLDEQRPVRSRQGRPRHGRSPRGRRVPAHREGGPLAAVGAAGAVRPHRPRIPREDGMTTSTVNITAAADRLALAAQEAVACAPIADLLGSSDIDAAYRVQETLTARRLAGGARIIGRKIGLTSEAVQRQIGVDRPDFGVLFDDMRYVSGEEIPISRLLQPKAEAEVAFLLAHDIVDPGDALAVRSAVALAYPALEIVDSRIADWRIGITDTVADNASSGVFVIGEVGHPAR